MRQVLMSTGLALGAAVAAAFIALAIDGDGGTTVVQEGPAAPEVVSEAVAVSESGGGESEAPAADAALDLTEGDLPESEAPAVAATESGVAFDPVAIFRDSGPSVVSILTEGGSGTGFFVDGDGNIVTNYHVVQGATTVTVGLSDGSTVEGRVQGFDNANDLAVVRVDPSGLAIRPVRLGDSDALIVGEPVAAIGHPFGLERTLTTGIVSATGRTRPPLLDGGRSQRGLIQTDAAVNPGNSGGPLINAAGEVVGVNASAESPVRGSVGTNFAVPVNLISRFLPALIAGETVLHPWIGINGGVADGVPGLPISDVVSGGPAEAAGLSAGDRIVSAAGEPLDDFEELAELIDTRSVGETLPFEVLRGGESLELPITLAPWPA